MIIFLPLRIRSTSVQGEFQLLTAAGIIVIPYVNEGLTIVTGKPLSRYSVIRRSSQAILSREYCQQGLASGVDSVMSQCVGGF